MKKRFSKIVLGTLAGITAALFVFLSTPVSAKAPTINFGVENWPGLTVKTQVAADIISALGYKSKQKSMNTPFVVRGLTHHSVDVALGIWYPLDQGLVPPLVKQGKIIKLTANLTDALSGLAVPAYVHQAGVDTVADLSRYSDRFDQKIYVIEAGSTYTQEVQNAVRNNVYDLGHFTVVTSSVAAMLAEVEHKTRKKQWIVFYGWQPHWMNISYDLYYLIRPPGEKKNKKYPIVDTRATVYTCVSDNFPRKHPNLTRFFKQYHVSSKTQSRWVLKYAKNKQSKKQVARAWIKSHPKIIRRYLKNVTTVDGKPGFPAVKAVFDVPS